MCLEQKKRLGRGEEADGSFWRRTSRASGSDDREDAAAATAVGLVPEAEEGEEPEREKDDAQNDGDDQAGHLDAGHRSGTLKQINVQGH